MTMEALPQDLADFLVTKNFDPEYFDKQGQPCEAGEAKTMKFDYVSDSGKNYGTAVCVIADDELSFFYGDNLGRGMEPEDKQEWFEFLEQLSNQAASHSATWSPTEINKLKHTLAGIAAIKEGLFEGYYGSRKISYMGEQTQARLVIKHNRVLGENDKRYRYVESLFIETADQERFRLPFKSLGGGRAMLEHVRSGGKPYDVRGNHIAEIVSEMAVLSRFNRAQHNRVFEGVTQELVESARQYYHNLQETIKHLGNTRGYQAYFESWAPDQVGEAEALVENLRNMFVEQTLDARIEAALPTLAKIQQQGNNMKEAQIFENWIQNLSEGTWALPETPEQMEKLNQLMSGELIVGPDATNATEQLYDLVGDDELFDILNDLADRSEGRANVWDDSDVQRRLAELGIQTPQNTEAEPDNMAEATTNAAGQRRLRDAMRAVEEDGPEMLAYFAIAAMYGNNMWDNDAMGDLVYDLEQANPTEDELKYIIVNKTLPTRLKSTRFTNTDDVQFGHLGEGEEADSPKYSMSNPGKLSNQEYKDQMNRRYGQPDMDTSRMNKAHQDFYDKNPSFKQGGREVVTPGDGRLASKVVPAVTDTKVDRIPMNTPGGGKKPSSVPNFLRGAGGRAAGGSGLGGVKPGQSPSLDTPIQNENAELARMLKHAGVPIREGVLTDSTGSTLEHIKDTFKRDVKDFMQTGEMSRHLEQVLYDYYYDDMPYGAKTGEDIDTSEWISDRFAEDLGMNENLITPMIMPVSEGSCNMTAEGSYCPEHGLAECGMMYEGVYDPDYRGNYNNEFDELEDLMGKSTFSHEEALRKRFLSQKYGLNTPADLTKLPALRKDAEAGYRTRKAEIDADLEKRNQQHLQDKLTDLEYQQDPVAFLKRRTQQLSPTNPTAPAPAQGPDASAPAADTGANFSLPRAKLGSSPSVKLPNFRPEPSLSPSPTPEPEPGVDYSLPRAKLGSSPSVKLPNFRPELSTEVPAPAPDSTELLNKAQDTLDSRLGPRNAPKQSVFQQLAQLRNKTRGAMAENSNDDPINSNSAITGAYYEGKETPTQEGDALLARIKSLALLK